jgi:hypothetical protein
LEILSDCLLAVLPSAEADRENEATLSSAAQRKQKSFQPRRIAAPARQYAPPAAPKAGSQLPIGSPPLAAPAAARAPARPSNSAPRPNTRSNSRSNGQTSN